MSETINILRNLQKKNFRGLPKTLPQVYVQTTGLYLKDNLITP